MRITNSFSSIFLMCLIIGLTFIKSTAANCCPCTIYGTCGDTSGCEAWSCCGTGQCNIFCCNCDGPCKGGALNALADAESASLCLSRFTSMDENQDGMISFLEWAQSRDAFANLSLDVLAKRWNQYDWEGKGYLTKDEATNRRIGSTLAESNVKHTTVAQKPFAYQQGTKEHLEPKDL